jgi:hypothetical protein
MIPCRKVTCLESRMLDRPNMKMDLQEIWFDGVRWPKVAQYRLLAVLNLRVSYTAGNSFPFPEALNQRYITSEMYGALKAFIETQMKNSSSSVTFFDNVELWVNRSICGGVRPFMRPLPTPWYRKNVFAMRLPKAAKLHYCRLPHQQIFERQHVRTRFPALYKGSWHRHILEKAPRAVRQ